MLASEREELRIGGGVGFRLMPTVSDDAGMSRKCRKENAEKTDFTMSPLRTGGTPSSFPLPLTLLKLVPVYACQ